MKFSKLLTDPIGVFGRRIKAMRAKAKYATADNYDAKAYWRARHGEFGFDLRGVGDVGMSQSENQRNLDEGRRLMLELCRREHIDLRRVSMLDVGCGTGNYAQALREAGGKNYVGIDIVDSLFDGLRQRFPGYEFVELDVSTTPLPGSYDLITMMDVAQHIVDKDRFVYAMENLRSHLREQGTIIISTILGPFRKNTYYCVDRPLEAFQEALPEFHISEPLDFFTNSMFTIRRR